MFFANTVVVASHRRSGMQWTIDALRNNSADINDSYMSLEQMAADHDGAISLAKFRRQLLNMDGARADQCARIAISRLVAGLG